MIFSAIFIISALLAALGLLEIRFLSFFTGHYLAYMVAVVGATGFAFAGTLLSMMKNIKNFKKLAFVSSILLTCSLPLVLSAVSRIPVDSAMPDKLNLILFVLVDYFLLFIPSFFAGLSLAALFEQSADNLQISLFFSILGCIAGILSAFPLLESFGMEAALSLTVCCSAASALLISFSLGKNRVIRSIALCLLILSCCIYPLKNKFFVFKSVHYELDGIATNDGTFSEYTEWNRAGRVDIVKNALNPADFNFVPEEKMAAVTVDGDAPVSIYDYSESYEKLALSLYSAGYFGLSAPDVFVAGMSVPDIAAAFLWNAKSVAAVESNKAKIDLITQKYSTFKDNSLKRGNLEIVNDDVRAFLEKTSKRYDLIQFSVVGTQSVLLNGMFIMNESYLYTAEAFNIYLDRLKENGTLSFISFMFWPPRETLKLVSMAAAALKKAGIENPENNILVIGNGFLASTLIKKRPFTWTELNELNELVLQTPDLRIVYAPGFSAGEEYYAPIFAGINFSSRQGADFIKSGFGYFFDSVQQGRENEFIADYPYNIKPTVDDSPFFFNYFKFSSNGFSKEIRALADLSSFKLIEILLVLAQLLFLAVSMLVSPLFFMSEEERKHKPAVQIFSCVAAGFGFMFVTITCIQKFTLLFGSPASSAVYAVAALLSFAALGALFSKKILILTGEKMLFGLLIFVLPVMILGYTVLFSDFITFCSGAGFYKKLFLASLFVAPLGFSAGTVFPVSLLLAGEKKRAFIPLAIGANSSALLLALVSSVVIAMIYGFNFVFVLSAFCYFFAVSAMIYFVKIRV